MRCQGNGLGSMTHSVTQCNTTKLSLQIDQYTGVRMELVGRRSRTGDILSNNGKFVGRYKADEGEAD